MNIREFAAKCGISATAVSRILNRPREKSQASPETYERIRQKAVELGYVPNYAAKTLLTRRSNSIGVILANPGTITAMSILRGASNCAGRHGISLSTVLCKNDPQQEAEALGDMLYRGVDAIIWLPTFQRDQYENSCIEAVLKKFPKHKPIFCLSDYAPAGIFKFRGNSAELAGYAAGRQLALGCRNFGILWNALTFPQVQHSIASYRDTLIGAGIPEENIADFVLNDPDRPPQWERFRDIQGLWVYLVPALHTVMPQIRSACNLKQLHVDGEIMLDEYAFSIWTNPREERFEDLFGSFQHYMLDLEKCAAQATEIAIRAINDPTLEPFDQPVEWQVMPPGYIPPEMPYYW